MAHPETITIPVTVEITKLVKITGGDSIITVNEREFWTISYDSAVEIRRYQYENIREGRE